MENEVCQTIDNSSNKKQAKKPKKRHLSRKQSAAFFVMCMLLFPILQFVMFWVIPNIDSIAMAFKITGNQWSTFQFETFWNDLVNPESRDHTLLVSSIINSLLYFAINIFICTPIVLFFSYVLFRKVPAAGVFKVIFYLPSVLGLTVTATLFLLAFTIPAKPGATGGPMWEMLISIGIIKNPNTLIDQGGLFSYSKTAFAMVIAYSIWTCVGLNMIMFHGAMKRIPNEIFESAEMDGVGFFSQFIKIVVPLIWPTISTLIIFSLSGIFISYGAIMILTPKVAESSMIGWYIMQKTTQGESQRYYAAAVGLFFTAIGLPFVLLIKKLLDKIGTTVEY